MTVCYVGLFVSKCLKPLGQRRQRLPCLLWIVQDSKPFNSQGRDSAEFLRHPKLSTRTCTGGPSHADKLAIGSLAVDDVKIAQLTLAISLVSIEFVQLFFTCLSADFFQPDACLARHEVLEGTSHKLRASDQQFGEQNLMIFLELLPILPAIAAIGSFYITIMSIRGCVPTPPFHNFFHL